MPALSPDQLKEVEKLINVTGKKNGQFFEAKAREMVAAAIAAERERLAHIVETCEPFSDWAGDDPLHVKDEVEDLSATLQALGRAIRTGVHE